MSGAAGFPRLVHADWSVAREKRWMVEARRDGDAWVVEPPRPVGDPDAFVAALLAGPQPTLAGFDFPIGLPAAFGRRTGFGGFTEALEAFGRDAWSRFYDVAERPEDISLHRPFYPRVSASSARQAHLLAALGVDSINSLRRECERKTAGRNAACALFWTLGGNQVGKAAISGWREIVQPARARGARLWPFDGALDALAESATLTVCETYPAEAYAHVGVRFRPGASKRRQHDRREASAMLVERCGHHRIHLTEGMRETIADGFGERKSGEDPFDAAMGLLGMIEVVEDRRTAMPGSTGAAVWEGWIIGQAGSDPA